MPEKDYDNIMDKAVKELLRVLKKDGVLVIVEFDADRFFGKCVKFFEKRIYKFGSHFLNKKKFTELFRKNKAEVKLSKLDSFCFIAEIKK